MTAPATYFDLQVNGYAGVDFNQDGLKPGRTAWEELRFQALWTGGSEVSARGAAEAFGLERLLDLEVRRLSAGQRSGSRRSGAGLGI